MFPPCLRGELEKQRTAVFLPFTPVAASAARGEAEISCHIFVAKQKYPTPDEKSGVRYEQTYSTVPPCLRSRGSAARVLCNGRSRPSLHIGGRLQGGGWGPVIGKSRLQPAAAPLWCLFRSASFSMPFFKFEDTIPRRCVPVKGTFCLFWRLFEGQPWWFFAGGRQGPARAGVSPARMRPPFSFVLTKENAPRPVEEKTAGGKTPRGALCRSTGVVRIGPSGVGRPVVPAPYPGSRKTLEPHRPRGGWAGWWMDLIRSYFRALRAGLVVAVDFHGEL